MPVGFKNGTGGGLKMAVNAIGPSIAQIYWDEYGQQVTIIKPLAIGLVM